MARAYEMVEPFVMDLKSIQLLPEDGTPEIATVSKDDGFFINNYRNDDFRIRAAVYAQLKQAKDSLPAGYHMMVFETYRSFAKQEKLWANTNKQMRERYPDMDDDALFKMCENFTACPYDGIGSGHMAACAIDLTLCDADGNEFDMGTKMHEKHEKAKTDSPGLTPDQQKHRDILKTAMENAGLINYPAEWWHFSHGDHQWAWLVGEKTAIYGILDI